MEENEKRGVGRPSIADEQKRGVSAAMYLTPAEHAAFAVVVEQSGMSVSNYLRNACHIGEEDRENVEKETK